MGGATGAPENEHVEVNDPNANNLAEDEVIQEGLFRPDRGDEADDAVDGKWPSQAGTSAAAPPGFSGTSRSTVVGAKDAAPAP